jgi:hypothetical protein
MFQPDLSRWGLDQFSKISGLSTQMRLRIFVIPEAEARYGHVLMNAEPFSVPRAVCRYEQAIGQWSSHVYCPHQLRTLAKRGPMFNFVPYHVLP